MPRHAAAQRPPAIIRLLVVGWAAFCCFIALMTWSNLVGLGFPDGYITPYAQETRQPLSILAVASIIQALALLHVGLIRRRATAWPVWAGLALAGLLIIAALLMLPACPRSPTCQDLYFKLLGRAIDDGAGG